MWIFKSTKSYDEMVDKISQSVFVISSILLFLLSQMCPEFMTILEKLSFGATFSVFNIKLSIALFYAPLLMGLFEHMFKLHDVWSSILGIRKRYDKNIVVKEIISRCALKTDYRKLSVKQVRKIMSACFYRYASSTDPVIDSHYITITLTEWCWFWILLDTLILIDIIGLIWLIVSWWSWINLIWIIGVNAILLTLMWLVKRITIKYTKDEISAIFSLKSEQVVYQTNNGKKIEDAIKREISNALSN